MITPHASPTHIYHPSTPPSLEDAQAMVGGMVELVCLGDGSQLLVNEEGLIHGLPHNHEASALTNGLAYIVGPAIHLEGEAVWT